MKVSALRFSKLDVCIGEKYNISVWNRLQKETVLVCTLEIFKSELKNYLK